MKLTQRRCQGRGNLKIGFAMTEFFQFTAVIFTEICLDLRCIYLEYYIYPTRSCSALHGSTLSCNNNNNNNCPTLSRTLSPCLPYHALSWPLPCPILSYPALPYPALRCPMPPHPSIPCTILPCHTLSCTALQIS